MFTSSPAFSGFAVDDVVAARRFYDEVLGVLVVEEHGLLKLQLGGDTTVLVYPKDEHVPATFTVLNFPVDDVEVAVDRLNAKGVAMVRYDGFPQDDKGIMRGNGPDIAWFTDPAGNVLSVVAA